MLDATCSSCPASVSIELWLVLPWRFICPPPSLVLASMCPAGGVREVKWLAITLCWAWGACSWDNRLWVLISTMPWWWWWRWWWCGVWPISLCVRRGDWVPISADLALLAGAAAAVDDVEVEGRPLFLGCVRSLSSLSFFLLFLNHSCTWRKD